MIYMILYDYVMNTLYIKDVLRQSTQSLAIMIFGVYRWLSDKDYYLW